MTSFKVIPSEPLLTQSFQGMPGGLNQDAPSHEIPNGEAQWLQDAILDTAGLIRRRGPLNYFAATAANIPARPIPDVAQGLVMAQDPAGNYNMCIVAGSVGTPTFWFWNTVSQTWQTWHNNNQFNQIVTTDVSRQVITSAPALGGGTWIGMASHPTPQGSTVAASSLPSFFLWKGAVPTKSTTTAALINTPVLCGPTGQAQSFTIAAPDGDIVPGMFVTVGSIFDSVTPVLVGVVQSAGAGIVTLDRPAQAAVPAGGSVTFSPFYRFAPQVAAGRITTVVTTPTVLGTQGPLGTKFLSQFGTSAAAVGANIFSAVTGAYIGTVQSVDNNAQITLQANSAVGVTNEQYFIPVPITDAHTTVGIAQNTVGCLAAQYNGRQWFAGMYDAAAGLDYQTRLWFSDLNLPQSVDFTNNGSWLSIQSANTAMTPITQIVGLANGLAVFKDSELWLVKGTDVTNFTVGKVADIGTISAMSVVAYQNGVLFAAQKGLFFYDGVNLRNVAPQLGTWYYNSLNNTALGAAAQFQPRIHRASGFVYSDHYVVTFDMMNSTYQMQRAGIGVTPGDGVANANTLTLVVNMLTGAVTSLSNAYFISGLDPSRISTFPAFALVRDGTQSSALADLVQLWTAAGQDTISTRSYNTAVVNSPGPSFYMETKRYDLGDPERKKLFKQIAMQYKLAGSMLSMDTVPGLQNLGTPTVQPWLTQTDWANQRKKFTKRATHISFRFYQVDNQVSSLEIGPWAIAYKLQRVGRV